MNIKRMMEITQASLEQVIVLLEETENQRQELMIERDEARKVAEEYADEYGGAYDLPWENN